LLCLVLASIAWWLGLWFPLVGGPVFAILLGILVGNLVRISDLARPGIAFCSKKVLQYSIILLGTDRNDARYIGAVDRNWRVIHYVDLPSGGSTASLMRGVPRF
jgi:uncharacterized membrane protein YadS